MTLILRRATNRAQIFHLRKNGLTQRNSLTVAELAALGASNNSTSVFQQNAARTLRSELVADLIAIIDYTDAYGGKSVRAVSGVDAAAIDAEIWLPDWLTPVDVDSPIKLVNIEPGRLSAISVVDPDNEYRSAVAIAIPEITGSAGLILALSTQPVDFDDSQIASAKTIASLLSLSASRSNALRLAQRGESQLAASRQITRSGSNSTGSSDTGNAKSPLAKISDQLRQFIEFDVLVIRVVEDDKFTTLESLGTTGDKPYVIADSSVEAGTDDLSIESQAIEFSTAVASVNSSTEGFDTENIDPAWKAAGLKSILAIPLIGATSKLVVLGSALSAAFAPEAVAIANRFIPALSAALADGGSPHVEARPQSRVTATPGPAPANVEISFEYFESIASTTELVFACGVIATQITNRTGASRVQVGFIDEETGRSELGFDTESSNDALDNAWISPDQIESLLELESADASLVHPKYLSMRTAIKSSDRVVGYVEAERVESGFDYDDIVQIKEIIAACAPVVATLKQLERSQATLGKLEMLRRVTDEIRSSSGNDSGDIEDPLRSPRIASLIRNLFDADWMYFGTVDHENDHSTAEITDGLDVPELAPGVNVSRGSLLVPSIFIASSPATIDLESAAPASVLQPGGCIDLACGRRYVPHYGWMGW